MKYFNVSLILLMLLSVMSCGNKEESAKTKLYHSTVRLDNEHIGKGGDIISCNEGIIGIEEASSLAPLYKIDTTKNKRIAFGVRGQGPDDFLHPYPLQYISEDIFGVYDMLMNTYKEIIIPKQDDETVRIVSNVKMEKRPYRVMKTAYNQYLGLSGTEGLFCLMDETGREIRVFFEYPCRNEDERSIKNHIRATAYQGILASDPDGKKCVYAPLDGEIIHFYEIRKDDVQVIKKIEKVFPTYSPDENGGSMANKENVVGYISVTATGNYVYALYCGKTWEELLKNGSVGLHSNEVRVFDWKGNLLKTYSLDVPCRYISASKDDKKLWAMACTPDIHLVSFHLTDHQVSPPEPEK
jgi:WD40 repeat protein